VGGDPRPAQLRLRLRAHPLHRARRRAGAGGGLAVEEPGGLAGPREEALAFLAERLEATEEPNKVVLMHCPPAFDGHFEPHSEWGFNLGEPELIELVREHEVALVCCAHVRGVCAAGERRPEDRGQLYHAVEITVGDAGEISGRVYQAFGGPRITF
jgi:hypothetical protein